MSEPAKFEYHDFFNIRELKNESEHSSPPCASNCVTVYLTRGLSGFLFFHDGKVHLEDEFALITPSHFDCSIFYSPTAPKASCVMLQINVDKILDILNIFQYAQKERTKWKKPKAGWLFYGGRVILLRRGAIKPHLDNLSQYTKGNQPESSNVILEFEQLHAVFNVLSIIGKAFDVLNSAKNLQGFKKEVGNKRIAKIIDYLDENYSSKIELTELAEHFKMPKTYLCQSFKKETNQTIINYLNNTRIVHAMGLLQDGMGNVSQVAMKTGFNDLNYFIQYFKKSTGITPKQFYKRNIGK